MDITHLDTGDGDDLRTQLGALFSDPPMLDPDADPAPVLDTGGVPGDWLSVRGQSAADGVTVYLHGGGFAHSNRLWERVMAYRLAQATARPAFRVDYRLAPAHPFPAAIEDAVTVYRALLDQGVPAEAVMFAGESAGATLVLSTLLVLKENGDPQPGHALAVSPVTDFSDRSAAATADGSSDTIRPGTMAAVGSTYLGGARPDEAPQSPAYGDLGGLAPLTLAVGTDEVLLADVRRFGELAAEAGVRVSLDLYRDMPHAFNAAVLYPPERHLSVATTFLARVGRLSDPAGRKSR
ncbi:alpha/beta hydrolase fold domain-containing protein [Fodinicola acaciae]|uniref:alpha/beta hydrolase fold domain-containing protein n=1 Tax=Fodinicola acaciae TaxID=2681555 RepID=UPI0013D688BA|nr:alpha/beta hydrolase fold domain-containing protein [Fodinicola acaciae]